MTEERVGMKSEKTCQAVKYDLKENISSLSGRTRSLEGLYGSRSAEHRWSSEMQARIDKINEQVRQISKRIVDTEKGQKIMGRPTQELLAAQEENVSQAAYSWNTPMERHLTLEERAAINRAEPQLEAALKAGRTAYGCFRKRDSAY